VDLRHTAVGMREAEQHTGIIHQFQNKVLWDVVEAPWYIRNADLQKDRHMEMVNPLTLNDL
jgi:hypothetical protein